MAALWGACAIFAPPARSQAGTARSFSDWIEASGIVPIEYRWRPNEQRGCDVEYKNPLDRHKRKYKVRIVFQNDGDERHRENDVLSFEDRADVADDHIPVCNAVTDITVTNF